MKKKFILEGLDCPNCAAKIENAVKKLDGVNEACVNFITTKLIIDADDDKIPEVIKAAEKLVRNTASQVVLRKG